MAGLAAADLSRFSQTVVFENNIVWIQSVQFLTLKEDWCTD